MKKKFLLIKLGLFFGLAIILFTYFCLPNQAHAQLITTIDKWPSNGSFTDVPTFANAVLTTIWPYAGSLAVLAVIYSGFMYITAGSDSDQAEKAKKNLTWAIIGVVLVAMSVLIVSQINRILH